MNGLFRELKYLWFDDHENVLSKLEAQVLFVRIVISILAVASNIIIWSSGASAFAGCVVGVSQIPCENIRRTILVAQDGSGNYRSIGAAVANATPGDAIQVKDGIYKENLAISHGGTSDAPVVIENYPGTKPIIVPGHDRSSDEVNIMADWIIFRGFEVTDGWNGILISANYIAVLNNYIHDNGNHCNFAGLSSPEQKYCGQGIHTTSMHDLLIEGNRIERNGLANPSPWHEHGIYLSDFNESGVTNITIAKNHIREHGGSAIQAWHSTGIFRNILIEDNVIENNTLEFIFTNVKGAIVRNNIINHLSHPKTDAPVATLAWLENNDDIRFEGNTIQYNLITATTDGTSNALFYPKISNCNILFKANVWILSPGDPTVNDRLVNAALNKC